MGPNCLQKFSADGTSRQRVKVGMLIRGIKKPSQIPLLHAQPAFHLRPLSALQQFAIRMAFRWRADYGPILRTH